MIVFNRTVSTQDLPTAEGGFITAPGSKNGITDEKIYLLMTVLLFFCYNIITLQCSRSLIYLFPTSGTANQINRTEAENDVDNEDIAEEYSDNFEDERSPEVETQPSDLPRPSAPV